MIVEDTVDLLANITSILKMEGYFVSSASNGKEALDILRNVRPDLIITDLLMPEMSGFELIRAVREEASFNTIPILVFSAMPPHEHEIKVIGLGANSYLKKPSTVESLVDTVHKLLYHE